MSDVELRRRRALYRAQHRGTKEMDFILGRYAHERLPAMDEAELTQFEQFLALPDPLLQGWMLSGAARDVPDEFAALVSGVRAYHGLQREDAARR